MITIHWDFTDGTEISYIEGMESKNNFTTHCLDFFTMDSKVEVIIYRKDGKKISLININNHSNKQIRNSHNARKMLVSGSLIWI